MIRLLKAAGALVCLVGLSAFAQTGVRYDNRVTTVAGNVPFGANAPMLAIPQASVTICLDGACASQAAIYSNQGLTVQTANPITTDGQGRFGFWAAAGSYFYKVQFPNSGVVQGIFPITLGGSGGTLPTSVPAVASNSLGAAIPATGAGIGSLFTGTGPCFLKSDGTCSSSSATFPGTVHQQFFSAGGGAATASNATLDLPGNGVFRGVGGTLHANFLTETTPGVSNDAIHNSLAAGNSFAVVDSIYGTTEAPNGVAFRSPNFIGSYTLTHPPYGANVGFMDNRPGNFGPFYSSNTDNGQPTYWQGKYYKDSNSRQGAQAYFPFNWDFINVCCGVTPTGVLQMEFEGLNYSFYNNVEGIFGGVNLTLVQNGFSDVHAHQTEVHALGNCNVPGDECAQDHRDAMLEDNTPFLANTIALAKGSTIISTVPASGARYPAASKLLIDLTQASAPFLVTAVTENAFPTPSKWTTDATFTPDTFCTNASVVSTPQLQNGATTSETLSLTGCTAAIVTTRELCLGDQSGVSTVVVTNVTGTLPNQTVTANLYRTLQANAVVTQGVNACKAVGLRAGENVNYKNIVQMLGFESAHVMDVISIARGAWVSTFNGFASTLGIPSGTVFSRNGSGVVTANITDPNVSFNGTSIIIPTASVPDASFAGTFVTSETTPGVVTWSNAGSVTTTTSTTGVYIKSGPAQANAAILYPAARIVQANNPTTQALDGTVVIDANSITFAFNDQVQAGPGDENAMYHSLASVAQFGTPSAGNAIGYDTKIWTNPCDGCIEDGVVISADPTRYFGGHGTRPPTISHFKPQGPPIWHDYITAPGPNSWVEQYTGCGLRACNDPAAAYITRNYQGDSTNTLAFLEQIKWGSVNAMTRQWGNSSETIAVKAIDYQTNDGVNNVAQYNVDSQVGITENFAGAAGANARRVATTVGGANITDFATDGTNISHFIQTPTGDSFDKPLTMAAASTMSNGSLQKGICLVDGTNCPAGGSTPLTTKGDLFGFSTTNARVPVGINGQVLTADSTNAAGVSYQTPTTGSGTVTPSPKFQIPYYSATGTASTVTGDSNITTDGAGNVTVASQTSTGVAGVGGGYTYTEGTATAGAAGKDTIWADSTAHRLKINNNNGGATQLVVSGADINTSDQVTVTHLAAALPVNQGGTGTTSTLVGLVRGGSPMTAAELSGDATTSGSNAVTVVKVNGLAVPASACATSTNASSQFTALTCTGSGNNVLATSPTLTTPNIGVATATSVNGTTIPASVTLTQTIASGTSALGTSAIASGACATVVTTTATGTASTDAISWNPNASIKAVTGYVPSTSGGLTIAGYPTTNAVNWDVCNWTSASITPGAVTLNWRVVR